MQGSASEVVSLFLRFHFGYQDGNSLPQGGPDEYLLNLSAPMVGDSVDVVLVIKGFGSFLTSGSSALRETFPSPGMEISELFLKISGSVSQLDSARSFGCRSRVAGLLKLSMYLRERDLSYWLDTIRYIDVKSSAFVANVAQDDLRICVEHCI